jgi:glycosyltransferase involved in cell wall biosynthesis
MVVALNVLHIVSSLSRRAGGVAPVVWELARHQQRFGLKVQIASLRDEFTDVDARSYYDLSYFTGKTDWFHAFGYSRELKHFCLNQMEKFDLVHSHGLWMYPGMLSGQVSRKMEIPLIVSPHGMLEPWAFKNNRLKKKLPWWLYQKRDLKLAHLLHVTSRQEANSLRELNFNNPLAIIPNAVELPERTDSFKGYNSIKTLLFLSRIHKKKGLINLVKAWNYVQAKGWRIVIAGPDEGGYQAEVEQEIRRCGFEDIFEFVGSVTGRDKWELYRNASVFVLPTYSENFGLVVAEALASGIPVITTKGAPWEELRTHKCGWWVEIGVEPLVKALQEATSLNPEELNSMGQRGRKLVEMKYSWESVGEKMLLAYEWVLKGGNPQGFIEVV